MEEILLYLALKYKSEWDLIYQSLEDREVIDDKRVIWAVNKVKSEYMTIVNPQYPTYFRNIYKPPFVLFYVGKFTNFNHPLITIVGELNELNVIYLKELSKEGYAFIYSVSDENIETAKKLMKMDFRMIFYLPNGIITNEKVISSIYHNLRPDTLVFSDAYESNNNFTNSKKIMFGHKNKIFFIGWDECSKWNDELILCKTEENKVYKLAYRFDQDIIEEWRNAGVKIIQQLSEIRCEFGRKN